jgi:hypothetical protein
MSHGVTPQLIRVIIKEIQLIVAWKKLRREQAWQSIGVTDK